MQTIYLDISNKGVIPCIQAKQSEVGRKFLAVITDNGVPYNIAHDSLLSVWYEGDTDAGNYSSIDGVSAFAIDGNKVEVELVAQMLLKPGEGELCLSISNGDGGETNTWNIHYEVEYKPGAGSAIPTEYYTALTDAAARAAEQVGLAAHHAIVATEAANRAIDAVEGYVHTDNLIDMVYPVGSVYISTVNSSPSLFIGGTWEKVRDCFLYAESDTVTAGSLGGAKTHTLTVEEMPAHSHAVHGLSSFSSNKDTAGGNNFGYVDEQSSIVGGGQPFGIMPPYLSVYMWKRTA